VAASANVIETVALRLGKHRCISARVCTVHAQNGAPGANARHAADIGPATFIFTATRASTTSGYSPDGKYTAATFAAAGGFYNRGVWAG
jgi:hypothetical protein